MRLDARLSRMLHVLVHMDRHLKRATSAQLSEMLCTHAVVVRRIMAGLRERGYVASHKGHGGGWVLQVELSALTLLDVYEALGRPQLFALDTLADAPECLVAQAVQARLQGTLEAAQKRLLGDFAQIRVSDIADDFARAQAAARG
jgi:DNA-binding IscR family transcriptional regulator